VPTYLGMGLYHLGRHCAVLVHRVLTGTWTVDCTTTNLMDASGDILFGFCWTGVTVAYRKYKEELELVIFLILVQLLSTTT
jgi:hypothetical protein